MAIVLPVNTKPKAGCIIDGCTEPRYGKHQVCQSHYLETLPSTVRERSFTVAETYERWGDPKAYAPQLWHGKFKVFGIKAVGDSYSLILGKHDEPVLVRADTLLRLVKGGAS